MGNCVDRSKHIMSPGYNKKIPQPQKRQIPSGKYTIQIQQGQPHVKFHHSPLTSCPFLQQKFTHSANKPQEVNLTFMILGVEVLEDQNIVSIKFINEKQVIIYLIIGGQMGMSNTGLIIDISNPKYVQKINRKEPTTIQGNSFAVAVPQLEGQNILVILQPNLKDAQSMYLTNLFVFNPQSKKYSKKQTLLQWSSLSFNLQDIYGSQTQFRCDKVQSCSVCLTDPANVILTPCRHMCMCNNCSKKYEKIQRRCPICRAQFHAFIEYT